jgi:hypothetical protein
MLGPSQQQMWAGAMNQGLISLPEGELLGSATGRQPPERRALRPGPDRKFVGMREELA